MNSIPEYSLELAYHMIKYNIEEYFTDIQSQYYNNLNIDFMDYFLSLIPRKNEFCIGQDKLKEYNIINTSKSKHILRALEKFKLKENVDYIILIQEHYGPKRINIKIFKLTPYAFKLCLIRDKKSFEYANYYLMLEEIFYYYKLYQTEYQNQLLAVKDKKIDTLNNKVDCILKENKEQYERIEELLNYGKITTNTLQDVKNELCDSVEMLDDINDKCDNIKNHLIINLEEDTHSTLNEFILLQHKENNNYFKFIKCYINYTKLQLEYGQDYNIIIQDYGVNPIQLFRMLKAIIQEELKDAKRDITQNKKLTNKLKLKRDQEKVKFEGTNFILVNNYSLDELLKKLKDISKLKINPFI